LRAGELKTFIVTQVAIVEDNRIIRETLARIVQSDPEFHCVYACTTAEEALEVIPRHKPDIILMDIGLPKMSGIDCITQLKQLLPSTQIIVVTVYEDTIRIFRALRAGASGYLLKRYSSVELIAAIREVKRGGAPMSREIARKVINSFRAPLTAASTIEDLTAREREILELLAKGFSNKEIAQHVGLSNDTIRWHLRHVYEKLHVRSRMEAAIKFRSTGPT
jgi:DNA-binding NarL/FixJ family response regulator